MHQQAGYGSQDSLGSWVDHTKPLLQAPTEQLTVAGGQ